MHIQLAASVGGHVSTRVLLALEQDDVARLEAGETLRGQLVGLGEEAIPLEVVLATGDETENQMRTPSAGVDLLEGEGSKEAEQILRADAFASQEGGRLRLAVTNVILAWTRDCIPVSYSLASLGLQHEGELLLIHRATDDATHTELQRIAASLACTLQPDTSHVTTYARDRMTGELTRTVRAHGHAQPEAEIPLVGLVTSAFGALVMLVSAIQAEDWVGRTVTLACASVCALVIARPARDAWRARR